MPKETKTTAAQMRKPSPKAQAAVDQAKAAARHRVAADLDHPAIWSCPFQPQFLVDFIEAAAEFGLNVISTEFAAFGENTEVVGIPWTF